MGEAQGRIEEQSEDVEGAGDIEIGHLISQALAVSATVASTGNPQRRRRCSK